MEKRRLPVHARAYRQALIAALVLAVSSTAFAVPKGKQARAAFDQGIAAYGKQDYAAAAEAFGRSYGLEADVETLFAWAQAERQAEHCDKAIDLYHKLLATKLPDENRKVIDEKLSECLKIVAAAKAAEEPKPEPVPEQPKPEPAVVAKPPPHAEGKSRFKDPLGGVLVVTGVGGLVVGGLFLKQANAAAADSKTETNYFAALDDKDRADSKGRLGVIATAAGGVLLVAGIVRYATRKGHASTLTGWIAPTGGGVTALGRF